MTFGVVNEEVTEVLYVFTVPGEHQFLPYLVREEGMHSLSPHF